MKTLSILKKLIHIYYYFMLIAFGLGIISFFIIMFSNADFELDFLGDKVNLGTLRNIKSIFLIILISLLFYFYFKAIHLIKMSLKDLSKGNYFSENVIKNFKSIGTLFLICGFGSSIVKLLLFILINNTISIGISPTLLLFTVMGLFFLFLSEVFAKARKTEEENELTI